MDRYTLGGRPLWEARKWDDDSNQEFGAILYKLFSSKFKVQFEGYQEFFHFRRDFIEEVFNEKLDALDKFRSEGNFKPIRDIIAGIRQNAAIGGIEPFNIIEGAYNMKAEYLEQISEGFRLIGEGLSSLCEELRSGACAAVKAEVKSEVKAETKSEVKAESKSETKTEVKQEPKKEEKAIAPDSAALRKQCQEKMIAMVNAGQRNEVVKVMADNGGKRLSDITDDKLEKVLAAFNAL